MSFVNSEMTNLFIGKSFPLWQKHSSSLLFCSLSICLKLLVLATLISLKAFLSVYDAFFVGLEFCCKFSQYAISCSLSHLHLFIVWAFYLIYCIRILLVINI